MIVGTISALQVFTEKGKPGTDKRSVHTVRGAGIEGDRHCFDKEEPISMISKEAIEWMQKQDTKGLCFQRFKANIVLDMTADVEKEGIAKIIPGTNVKAGEAVLSITSHKKKCFVECIRYQKGMECKLKDNCWFAATAIDGEIHVDDEVNYEYSWNRYQRQMLVPGIGEMEQEHLKNSSILLIGAGGLGCPVLTAISEAGVGRIGIMDGDVVEETNLNRQYLYAPSDIGKNKAECARRWVHLFRPDCQITAYQEWFNEAKGRQIISDYDIVIAAVDQMSTRLMINRIAAAEGKPLIDGAIDGFYGTVTAVLAGDAPCLACLNPEGKESGHTSSSMGTTTMIIGALEAQFALQYLAGISIKSGYVLSYDGVSGTLEELPIKKNPDCIICGEGNMRQKNNGKRQ